MEGKKQYNQIFCARKELFLMTCEFTSFSCQLRNLCDCQINIINNQKLASLRVYIKSFSIVFVNLVTYDSRIYGWFDHQICYTNPWTKNCGLLFRYCLHFQTALQECAQLYLEIKIRWCCLINKPEVWRTVCWWWY